MPMHDWTRVNAGTYHDFHCRWLGELTNQLNGGILPGDYYAQMEQVTGGMVADILTLHADEPDVQMHEGGVAIAAAPPRVRITDSIDLDQYACLAKRIAIRHGNDDQVIALIEILSPGNKSSAHALRTFVGKALDALSQNCHLLIVDPFPPGPRDPQGIHGVIWEKLGGNYEAPPDKPLTLVSYDAGLKKTAYIEPIAVGDVLADMPLLLSSERYVPAPLEESYMHTFTRMPPRWQNVLVR